MDNQEILAAFGGAVIGAILVKFGCQTPGQGDQGKLDQILQQNNLIIQNLNKMNEQLEQQIIEAKANTAALETVKTNVLGIAKDYASMKAKIDKLSEGQVTQEQIDALKEANASQRTSLEALGLQTKELDDLETQESEGGEGGGEVIPGEEAGQ